MCQAVDVNARDFGDAPQNTSMDGFGFELEPQRSMGRDAAAPVARKHCRPSTLLPYKF
jgi:hypothetical protein